MKKSTIRRLLVLCLCLTLITVSLIGGTLAKYTTTVSGTVTGTVASWDIALGSENTTTSKSFTAALGTIKPGDSGTITITVQNKGDVDATLTTTLPTSLIAGFTMTEDTNSAKSVTAGQSATVVINWSYNNDGDTVPTFPTDGYSISIKAEQTTDGASGNIATVTYGS